MFSISGIVHLRSKALERTILKIWAGVKREWLACGEGEGELVRKMKVDHTFCTLMLWLVLLKMRLARIAFAKRRA